MGGTIWLAVLFMGGVATAQAPQLYVSIDYIFVFCGFLLALAVCAALFSARSAYARGCARGREEADGAIARHMVDRLIEHPDNWDDLDSDYLEVESALDRVRERERLAAQALRDESGRKDDLVTYLAHDLKTPLASVVGCLLAAARGPRSSRGAAGALHGRGPGEGAPPRQPYRGVLRHHALRLP